MGKRGIERRKLYIVLGVKRPKLQASHNLKYNVLAGDRVFYSLNEVCLGEQACYNLSRVWLQTCQPTLYDEEKLLAKNTF